MPQSNRHTDIGGIVTDPNRDTFASTSAVAGEEGMPLTDVEAGCLATYLLAQHIADGEWLEWEDVPNLGEHAFKTLAEAADALAGVMFERSKLLDAQMGVDSPVLNARLSEWEAP